MSVKESPLVDVEASVAGKRGRLAGPPVREDVCVAIPDPIITFEEMHFQHADVLLRRLWIDRP